ncbi:hypothetical protein H072_7167 [Dactylellina haptotyla CBS 200.50]|uniref:Rhodopsin domain-containing protein n=1 Tax=Dactylellina haptotyla (strain CBS 200.50) TaxID=1284197 RepID=S8AD86_DACHA|nr:hypothetical protein H072_7167 [Dactylellina haptotyla CBS 200.50]
MDNVVSGTSAESFGYQIPDISQINFNDKSNYVHLIIIVNSVLMGLIVLFMVARIYARVGLASRFQADDALMVAATLVSLTCSSIILYSIRLGLGHHIWNQDLSDLDKFKNEIGLFAKILNDGAGILYSFSLNLVKCSIVVLYIRVFPVKWFRFFLFGVGFILIASFLMTLFVVVFHCKPISASWDWTIPDAKCLNLMVFLQTMAGVNVTTDVILATAPIPMIWNLKMSRREKFAIASLVTLASFACIASIIRFIRLDGLKNFDITYSSTLPIIWSVIEVDVAIICASASSIKPILVRHFPFWGFFNRSLVTVNELPHNQQDGTETTKNSTFTTANRVFSNSSSESYVANTGYLYTYRPQTPESPRTVKREWAYDSINSSNRDRLSGEPVNWDDYWKENIRDDISAPIDKDIRMKVEAESASKPKEKSGGKRLSLSNFIPMDTFRRPSATSSHKSKDEEKDLRREKSNESLSHR